MTQVCSGRVYVCCLKSVSKVLRRMQFASWFAIWWSTVLDGHPQNEIIKPASHLCDKHNTSEISISKSTSAGEYEAVLSNQSRASFSDGYKIELAPEDLTRLVWWLTSFLTNLQIWTDNVRTSPTFHSVSKSTLVLILRKKTMSCFSFIFYRTLANYIVWNVIQDEVSFLSKPYRKARTQYRERVLGSKGQKKRWKTCVTFTNELLGDILGSAYVEHHFTKKSKKMVRERS